MDNAELQGLPKEGFNVDEVSPDNVMLMASEAYEPTYRNVPCQPQEAEFRGVYAAGPTQVLDFFPNQHNFGDMAEPDDDRYFLTQQQKKAPENLAGIDIKLDLDGISFIDDSCSPVCVPQPPMIVLSTSFTCKKSADEIVASINNVFTEINVSYEFSPTIAEYNAVFVKGKFHWLRKYIPNVFSNVFSDFPYFFDYLLGATYTKLQFHIYNEDCNCDCDSSEPHTYIVEAQRMSGDGFAFNSIFGEVRSALCGAICEAPCPSSSEPTSVLTSARSSRSASLSNCSSYSSSPSASNCMMDPLTEDEKNLFVEPIVKMTDSTASMESQLEGCRLLCDMIVSNVNFHQQLCECGCVDVLMRLTRSDSFLTCQHAVIALTALSKCEVCLKGIWSNICAESGDPDHKGFLEFLCSQFVDGPYYSEAKRRQSAELLTNMLEYLMREKNAAVAAKQLPNLEVVNLRILSPRASSNDLARSRSSTTFSSTDSGVLNSPSFDSNDCGSIRLNDDVLESCINRIQVVLEKDMEQRLNPTASF